jgi:hypothetical protein
LPEAHKCDNENSNFCDFLDWALSFSPLANVQHHTVSFGDQLKVHFMFISSETHFSAELGERELILWEDIWLQKKELVKARIAALLGKTKKIYARNTNIIALDKTHAASFLNENHLMGFATAKYKVGLAYKGILVAVALFSSMKKYYRNGVLFHSAELVRFANMKGIHVQGGLSKLLDYFIAERKPDDIMTYADKEWTVGNTYKKLGFKKVDVSPPIMFWVHPQQLNRLSWQEVEKLFAPKQPLTNKELENYLLEKGYRQIFNQGNDKYLLLLK